jgi:hypothetical protein
MIVQGQWWQDNTLKYIPHFGDKLQQKLESMDMTELVHLSRVSELDFDKFLLPLNFSTREVNEMVSFLSRLPFISIDLNLPEQKLEPGDTLELMLNIRNLNTKLKKYDFSWFCCVSFEKTDELFALKRFQTTSKSLHKTSLSFIIPEAGSTISLNLHVMSSNFLGLNYVVPFDIRFK